MPKYIDVVDCIKTPSAFEPNEGDVIYNIIAESFDRNEQIVVDFKNVESMLTPFLNNAIGQLYGKYTSDQIRKYLILDNFPKNKNKTLNIVISNAKKFYNHKSEFEKLTKEVLNGVSN